MMKPEPQIHISQKMATVDKINPKKQKDMFETDFPLNTTGDKDRKKRKTDNNTLHLSEVGQFCPEEHIEHPKRSYHNQYAPTFSSIKIQKDIPSQIDRKKRNRKNPNQM